MKLQKALDVSGHVPCLVCGMQRPAEVKDAEPAGMETMPAWMSLLHGSVASQDTPQYARLFLVKAVLHVEARHAARMAAAGEQEQVSLFACC